MRKSSKFRALLLLSIPVLLLSCNKEGQGGTASIEGVVVGTDHDFARSEITQVSFTNGNAVEHGDYWLLNSPDLANYFYIWYDNPSWITNGDPGLQGRIGIQVTFNYSDSNIDIANNTMAAITATTPIFNMELNNDVLLLTCTLTGDSPDAEDVTSPFSIDIAQQGQDVYLGNSAPLVDEKVYITYGEGDIHDDIEQTSADGRYKFIGLQPGTYTVFTFSKDTVNGGSQPIEQTIEVKKGDNHIIDDFNVIY